MNRAIFLDRDGTINKLVRRKTGEFTSPHLLEELEYLPRVQEAIANMRELGYKILIVTNQPAVCYGDMSVFECVRICNAVKAWVRADDIYPCLFPIYSAQTTDDIWKKWEYKPGAGAILKLMEKWNIDAAQSYMIGDRWKDIVAGRRAGLTTIYVGPHPYESDLLHEHVKPSFQRKDLWEASELLEALEDIVGSL
jgi:D-glycero-D-manno-heptose 1,7-bisphosphate phosphatase